VELDVKPVSQVVAAKFVYAVVLYAYKHCISLGLMSVFEVGIGFSVFFKVSSVSIFQNTAISVFSIF